MHKPLTHSEIRHAEFVLNNIKAQNFGKLKESIRTMVSQRNKKRN